MMKPAMSFYADPPSRNGKTKSSLDVVPTEPPKLASKTVVNGTAKKGKDEYKLEIKWRNVLIFLILHVLGIYGLYIPKLGSTVAVGWFIGIVSGLGTTVGSHRLFTHKTFKANRTLKRCIIFVQTMAGQEPILKWARDHRVHHKFTDTNADPYNSRRGFFFCHIGWLMCKKHPDVIEQGKKVDMTDLESDPDLKLQQKYFIPAMIFLNFFFPPMIACCFGEVFRTAFYGNLWRYVIGLHMVWSVNSVAHLWGAKPYDKNISPTDTYLIGLCSLGEGWHNYHHIFPWDYKTSELPGYMFNISTAFIDMFARFGWATELKTVPDNIIKRRILRTGDGSHIYSKDSHKHYDNNNFEQNEAGRDIEHFWGFGDKEMTKQDMENVQFL